MSNTWLCIVASCACLAAIGGADSGRSAAGTSAAGERKLAFPALSGLPPLDRGSLDSAHPGWRRAVAISPLRIAYTTIKVGSCCATSVAWAPDGSRLAVGVGTMLRVLRRDGTGSATIAAHAGAVMSVAWSPNGAYVAAGYHNGTVHLYHTGGAPLSTLTGQTGAVTVVRWSPDGQLLAGGSADGTVRLWQANGQLLTTLSDTAQPVQTLAWAPAAQPPYGRMLAIGAGGQVRLEWLGGRIRSTLPRLGGATDVSWAPDARTIAVGSHDASVRLFGADGRPRATLRGHRGTVTAVAWVPNSARLASGSLDGTVRLWSASGYPLTILRGHAFGVRGVAWSPDGTTLASVADDGTVRLWPVP